MIEKGIDIKLTVQPIYITLHHDYVFEGPCRHGSKEQLTREYDEMINAENIKELSKTVELQLASRVVLRSAIWIDQNEEFLVESEMLDQMSAGSDQVDVYLVGATSRLSDLLLPFVQRVKKPVVICPAPSTPKATIIPAALRARGYEAHAFLTWGETIDCFEALRVKKCCKKPRSSVPRGLEQRVQSAGWITS